MLRMLTLVKKRMKLEETSGERRLPCMPVDASGNSLIGSGPSGSLPRFLWRLCKWCVGSVVSSALPESVQTERLQHGPLFGKEDLLLVFYTTVSYGLGDCFRYGACGIYFVSRLSCLSASILPIQISHLFGQERMWWKYLHGLQNRVYAPKIKSYACSSLF